MSDTALSTWGRKFVAQTAFFSRLKFYIYGPEGNLQFFVHQKAFKLKEEISVFKDESKDDVRLTIQARGILDVSATYDITDPATGEKVGAMKRKGLKSILKDEWAILDNGDAEIGIVVEASTFMALLTRVSKGLVPQTYAIKLGGNDVGMIKQRFGFFTRKFDVSFTGSELDPRMGIAAVVLLLAIEGAQK